MIDVSSERLLSLTQAAKFLPSRPNLSTLHRWRLRGVRGQKLETCLVGGRRFTSAEALERFVAATTAAHDGQPVPVRTPAVTKRIIARAEAELAKAGI